MNLPVESGKRLTTSWWTRINDYANQTEVVDDLPLSAVLRTTPWVTAENMMRDIEGLHSWPAGKKRSAFFLFVADKIENGVATKYTRRGEARVRSDQPMVIGGRDQNHGYPPYWVLTVIDCNRDGVARVREAFTQHASDSEFAVPLDSHYERRTLECLLTAIEWLHGKGVNVTLTKPLFDIDVTLPSEEEVCCRPDFELEFDGEQGAPQRVVIETMGSDSSEYLAKKTETHSLMRRRGDLIKHIVRDDGQQGERDDAFRKFVYARVLELAGKKRPSEKSA